MVWRKLLERLAGDHEHVGHREVTPLESFADLVRRALGIGQHPVRGVVGIAREDAHVDCVDAKVADHVQSARVREPREGRVRARQARERLAVVHRHWARPIIDLSSWGWAGAILRQMEITSSANDDRPPKEMLRWI
jgi:hypothetical protein